ncbi:MAG: TetR/AcrR family transcriptional regulator [Lachnospiraceae bacterium]
MISSIYKDPPPKVRQMFQACSELIEEGMPIHSIKVVDITSRAGIGKGTAYEYFRNKEELIGEAQLYYFNEQFLDMKEKVAAAGTFWDAVDCLLDMIDQIMEKREGLQVLFKHAVTNIREELREDQGAVCRPPESLASFLQELARRAIRELNLSETSEFRVGNIITSQIMSYGLFCVVDQDVYDAKEEVQQSRKKYREICKNSIVKLFES